MKYGGVFMDIAYETAVIFIFSAVIMCLSAVSALRGADKRILIFADDSADNIELLLRHLATAECDIIVCCADENSETAEICRRFACDNGIPRLCTVCDTSGITEPQMK